MRVAALLAVLTLAACGIDGPPSTPGGADTEADGRIGVVGNR